MAKDLPFRLVEDPEDRLGPLASGHVAGPEDVGLRLSVGTAQDVRNGLDPDVPSVSNPVPVLRHSGFSGHRPARQLGADHLAVVGVDEVEGVRAEELSGRPARHDLVRRADELEPPPEVHLADHVDHVVGQPLQIRDGRPQLQLALAEGLFGAFPLDGLGDLGGDEDEEVAILLGVADFARVALDHQDADGPVAAAQRDAEPVDRGAPDGLDLAGSDELLEDGGRGEKGPARPENVLRQALAERLRRKRLVHLVDEVRKAEDVAVRVVQGDVEIGGLHQPAHDRVDPREQLLQALGRCDGFGDPEGRRLNTLSPLPEAFPDVRAV